MRSRDRLAQPVLALGYQFDEALAASAPEDLIRDADLRRLVELAKPADDLEHEFAGVGQFRLEFLGTDSEPGEGLRCAALAGGHELVGAEVQLLQAVDQGIYRDACLFGDKLPLLK
ncbi:MAG: hypothetical protein VYD64_02585, partial [Pseudomonadota bacterium]|nr:hypothetical protein [Pseudomonadota bacterium]